MLLIQFICATTSSTSTEKERRLAWRKQEANCTRLVSTRATQCLDLGLGLLQHGFRDKASLNLASSRLWHDVGEEDLLIVRYVTRR
jgi:hypothetical protein